MLEQRQNISPGTLCAILDYLSVELDEAKTTDELAQIMEVAKLLLLAPATRNMVLGLPNIRAQIDAPAPTENKNACTLQLEVPAILSDAFQDLSWRMNTLQDQDPETFSNAASALRWLAKGKLTAN